MHEVDDLEEVEESLVRVEERHVAAFATAESDGGERRLGHHRTPSPVDERADGLEDRFDLCDEAIALERRDVDDPQPRVVEVARAQHGAQQVDAAVHVQVADEVVAVALAAAEHGDAVEAGLERLENVERVETTAARDAQRQERRRVAVPRSLAICAGVVGRWVAAAAAQEAEDLRLAADVDVGEHADRGEEVVVRRADDVARADRARHDALAAAAAASHVDAADAGCRIDAAGAERAGLHARRAAAAQRLVDVRDVVRSA